MKDIKHLLNPITAITLGLFVAAGAAAGAESAKKPHVSQTSFGAATSPVEPVNFGFRQAVGWHGEYDISLCYVEGESECVLRTHQP